MSLLKSFIGIIAEKDVALKFTRCNKVTLMYAGIKSEDAVLGLTDEEMPWYEYAELYRAHEIDAIKGQQYSAIIPMKTHLGETKLFLHNKCFKKNAQDRGIVHCNAIEIVNPNFYRLSKAIALNKRKDFGSFTIGKPTFNVKLSERQEEILFLLIRGKTAKSIAKILQISPRTIEYYIEILKNKFNCATKLELIEKITECNITSSTPSHLTVEKILKYIES